MEEPRNRLELDCSRCKRESVFFKSHDIDAYKCCVCSEIKLISEGQFMKVVNEKTLFKLEKKLIKKHRNILGDLKPRPIKIIETTDYKGHANKNFLKLSRQFLDVNLEKSIIRTMLHELNHYSLENENHSLKFLENMKKMGYDPSNYEVIENEMEKAEAKGETFTMVWKGKKVLGFRMTVGCEFPNDENGKPSIGLSVKEIFGNLCYSCVRGRFLGGTQEDVAKMYIYESWWNKKIVCHKCKKTFGESVK